MINQIYHYFDILSRAYNLLFWGGYCWGMARERRKSRRSPLPIVALRIQPEVLAKYKALGRGYSGIMADVLRVAADNPEILKKARP